MISKIISLPISEARYNTGQKFCQIWADWLCMLAWISNTANDTIFLKITNMPQTGVQLSYCNHRCNEECTLPQTPSFIFGWFGYPEIIFRVPDPSLNSTTRLSLSKGTETFFPVAEQRRNWMKYMWSSMNSMNSFRTMRFWISFFFCVWAVHYTWVLWKRSPLYNSFYVGTYNVNKCIPGGLVKYQPQIFLSMTNSNWHGLKWT